MRRILLVLSVAALVALMVVVMAMPAFARGNPQPVDTPYAGVRGEHTATCVETLRGPADPPGSSARGGNPGYQVTNHTVGPGC